VDIQARQAYSRTGGISCHGHAPADAVPRETGVLLRRLAACRPARVGGLGLLRLGEVILRSGLWRS